MGHFFQQTKQQQQQQSNNNNNTHTHTHMHPQKEKQENEMKLLVSTHSFFILNGVSISRMINRMPFL